MTLLIKLVWETIININSCHDILTEQPIQKRLAKRYEIGYNISIPYAYFTLVKLHYCTYNVQIHYKGIYKINTYENVKLLTKMWFLSEIKVIFKTM